MPPSKMSVVEIIHCHPRISLVTDLYTAVRAKKAERDPGIILAIGLDPPPDNKILDRSKLKQIADDISK